jgi:hypothetical protein
MLAFRLSAAPQSRPVAFGAPVQLVALNIERPLSGVELCRSKDSSRRRAPVRAPKAILTDYSSVPLPCLLSPMIGYLVCHSICSDGEMLRSILNCIRRGVIA